MKPRVTILLSVVALLLLAVIQLFLIKGLYELRRREFDTRYSKKVDEALSLMQEQYNTNGMDSVFILLDHYALNSIESFETTFEDSAIQDVKKETLKNVQAILQQYEKVSPFLRWFLEQQQMENDFVRGFLFHQLIIIGPDQEYTILDDTHNLYPSDYSNTIKKQALQVNTFHLEGSYFRVWFDYYIDFTHRTTVLLREMILAFVLALLSVIISSMVFMITLRNMLQHKRLSEMKTDFINNMAHELRTPLTTIAVASGSLENPKLERQKISELTTIIKHQNKELSKMIEQILDINLWEKDQIRLRKKKVNMEELLKNRIDAFSLEHRDEPLSLSTDFRFTNPEVSIDEFQIGIAIHNLLSNAVKYGGDPVTIHVKSYEKEEEMVIEVQDNGPGIPEKLHKKVFEKFYRAPHNHKTNKGLGLGLYYVRKIVNLHGGDVDIVSKPDRGTTFIIRIPVT